MRVVLARLQQREELERLVLCAVPAGEHRARVGLPRKEQLAGEEILEVDELGVVHDRRVGLLLEREQDVSAEAVLPPGSLVRRPHDPLSRPRDDHELAFGQEAGEAPGQIVQGILRRHPRGSEDGDLPPMPVLPEEPEGIAHLPKAAVKNLEIQHFQTLLLQPNDRTQQVFEKRRLRVRRWQRQQLLELLAQAVIRNRRCGHRRCPSYASLLLRLERPVRHDRSEEHTSELQSPCNLVCRLLLEKKKKKYTKCCEYY